jgi:hypothetical protein
MATDATKDKKGITPLEGHDAADLRNNIFNWYNALYKAVGKKPPANLVAYAVKHRLDQTQFENLVREKDKNWENSPVAKEQRQAAVNMLTSAYGNQSWRKDKKTMEMVKRFGVIENVQKLGQALKKMFEQVVMKDEKFLAQNRGFTQFYKTWKPAAADQNDPGSILRDYKDAILTQKKAFQQEYVKWMGAGSTMPDELFYAAFEKGWEAGGPEWQKAIQDNDASWATGPMATTRKAEFERNWKIMYSDGKGGVTKAMPADALTDYSKSALDFTQYFHEKIKDSAWFKQDFGDYADWETLESRDSGNPADKIDVFDYFKKRAEFITDYKESFGPDAQVDSALLTRAMRENWSTAIFHNYVMKNDPKAKETDEYKRKADDFNLYWKGVFGENSTPDQGLMDQYVTSGSSDPLTMWDSIKSTGEFKSQYANWDAFSAGQEAAGNVVMDDPMQYKEYQRGMEDAFAKIGMQTPGNMVRQIFASGIDTGELGQNLETFAQDKTSYDWQTGQQADLATAAGVANKPAGGDLRKRMEAALAQHRAYAGSKFNEFDTGQKNDMITKKI